MSRMTFSAAFLPAVAVLLISVTPGTGQTKDANSIATLYRSSAVIENARLHVATFDAEAKGGSSNTEFDYNWANCTIAMELFQNQPGVTVRYWCEKGRFQK
jgi:hypothetical protein